VLTIWRRHKTKCPHKADRYYRKCRCVCHVEGTIEGKYRRESLKTRSWERAIELVRDIEDGKVEAAPVITLTHATKAFLADLQAQNRTSDTVRKYRLLFSHLEKFGEANHLSGITEFTFEQLAAFRAGWTEKGVNTKNKKLDRLKAFFGFCHDAGMVLKNPASPIKAAAAPKVRVQPFSPDEQAKMLGKPQTARYRAFVHTLYHSGLRISDACFLRPEDFDGNCIRRVNRKNQVEIYVPVPPYLRAELDRLPLSGGYYFLIGESENLHTQTDAWRTILNDLFPKTDFPGFHPHRFRHTRVVEWLAHGLTLEEISGMIGTSIKILEKHYASFAPSRQKVVAEKLNTLWTVKQKLVRVK
jgi:integrase